MPELPEVEKTALSLGKKVRGARIAGVRIGFKRAIALPAAVKFSRGVKGSTIESVWRRGKFVVFNLARRSRRKAERSYMLCHLRMSGSLNVGSPRQSREKHEHVIFSLADGRELRFRDTRKFGRFYLVKDHMEITASLGAEPFEISASEFAGLIGRRRGAIKTILTNQKIIAGVGNIYADEALWAAKIHPASRAEKVFVLRLQKLHSSLVYTLKEAIKKNGTDFGDGVVFEGGYRPRVYGREGLPCRRCSSLIKRITMNQRSTHFCPKCQRRK